MRTARGCCPRSQAYTLLCGVQASAVQVTAFRGIFQDPGLVGTGAHWVGVERDSVRLLSASNLGTDQQHWECLFKKRYRKQRTGPSACSPLRVATSMVMHPTLQWQFKTWLNRCLKTLFGGPLRSRPHYLTHGGL